MLWNLRLLKRAPPETHQPTTDHNKKMGNGMELTLAFCLVGDGGIENVRITTATVGWIGVRRRHTPAQPLLPEGK